MTNGLSFHGKEISCTFVHQSIFGWGKYPSPSIRCFSASTTYILYSVQVGPAEECGPPPRCCRPSPPPAPPPHPPPVGGSASARSSSCCSLLQLHSITEPAILARRRIWNGKMSARRVKSEAKGAPMQCRICNSSQGEQEQWIIWGFSSRCWLMPAPSLEGRDSLSFDSNHPFTKIANFATPACKSSLFFLFS